MHTALEAWREPRTYLIGVVMLGMSFAEGGANDWIALGTEQGHGFAEGTGAVSLAVFSVGMTIVRLFGGPLVDRFGRVLVLRVLAVAAASASCCSSSLLPPSRSCSSGRRSGVSAHRSASRWACPPRRTIPLRRQPV